MMAGQGSPLCHLLTPVSVPLLVTGFMKGDRVKFKAPEEVCRRNSGYRAIDYIKIRSEGVITGKEGPDV